MKKLVIIAVVMVVALGMLGAGYAMWYDDVVIKGIVSTANVDINVQYYSMTYAWKTMTGGVPGIFITYDAAPPPDAVDNDLTNNDPITVIDPLGYARAYAGDADDTVIMDFYHLFPLEIEGDRGFCADFGGVYEGTIPVHLAVGWHVNQGDLTDDEWAAVKQIINDSRYTHIEILIDGVPQDRGGVQLHPGDAYNVRVCIDMPQTMPDGNTGSQDLLSDKDFTVTAKLVAYQWNEPAPAMPSPTTTLP